MQSALMLSVPIIAFLVVVVFDAPIGYEDHRGFHYGAEPDDGE